MTSKILPRAVKSNQLVTQPRVELNFLERRLEIFPTFAGNLYCSESSNSPISKAMALKIAGSGLPYEDLRRLYQTFDDASVVEILARNHYCQRQPKCSRSADKETMGDKPQYRILSNIILHFQLKYGSARLSTNK